MIQFKKYDGEDRKEEEADKAEIEPDLDQEDIEDMIIDNKRECHWRTVLEYNDGRIDN